MGRNNKRYGRDTYDNRRRQDYMEQEAYIYGNTVRKPEPVRTKKDQRQTPVRKPRTVVRKNRDKARYMNAGYVMFLVAALCGAAYILVNYIQLQAHLTNLTKIVAIRESTLNDLKVKNDEAYNRIISGIDLEEIKRIALMELGMVYAQEGQIIEYENKSADYMRQVTENE